LTRLGSAPKTSDSASNNPMSNIIVGLDVGSTTIKAVVMDPETDETLWKDHKRQATRQPEIVFHFLQDILEAFPLHKEDIRILITPIKSPQNWGLFIVSSQAERFDIRGRDEKA